MKLFVWQDLWKDSKREARRASWAEDKHDETYTIGVAGYGTFDYPRLQYRVVTQSIEVSIVSKGCVATLGTTTPVSLVDQQDMKRQMRKRIDKIEVRTQKLAPNTVHNRSFGIIAQHRNSTQLA